MYENRIFQMAWFKHHPASLIKYKSSWKEAGGFMTRCRTGERLGEYLWVTSRNSTDCTLVYLCTLKFLLWWFQACKCLWLKNILVWLYSANFWILEGARETLYVYLFGHIYHTVSMSAYVFIPLDLCLWLSWGQDLCFRYLCAPRPNSLWKIGGTAYMLCWFIFFS